MPNLEPTAEEFKLIEAACVEMDVRPSAITTDILDLYKRGDFDLHNIRTWLAEQKKEGPGHRTHFFATEIPGDLEAKAFGENNMTARAQLFKQLGAVEYAEREAKWNASGFKLGTRPKANGEDMSNTPARDNPWSADKWNVTKQAQIVRAMGVKKANQIAAAAQSYVGATRPARVA
jgi:hypothetical protein